MAEDNYSMGDLPTLGGNNHLNVSIGDAATLRPDGGPGFGRVDRYVLKEKLGQGGFGAVYRALDEEAGVEVALKALPALVSHSPEELESIRRNFALVSRLVHSNIANVKHLHRVESVDTEARSALHVSVGDYLVVMEYVPGSTLSAWRHLFPGRQVPVEQAIAICRQIAEALDYAHTQNIIHRDIKPSNVMVGEISNNEQGMSKSEESENPKLQTPNSTVKVLDFGLAAEIRSSMSRVSREENSTSGTRLYMAPEQWTGRRQGAATDQYALAVLFYELVSGAVPFASAFETGDSAIMLSVVQHQTPEPPAELSEGQNEALLRALAKNPDDRFECCADFFSALEDAAGVSPKKIARSLKGMVIAGVIGVLIALGVLQWWDDGRSEPNAKLRQGMSEGQGDAAGVDQSALPESETAIPAAKPELLSIQNENAASDDQPDPLAEIAERKQQFEIDYAAYKKTLSTESESSVVLLLARAEIFEKWKVDPGIVAGALFWDDASAEVQVAPIVYVVCDPADAEVELEGMVGFVHSEGRPYLLQKGSNYTLRASLPGYKSYAETWTADWQGAKELTIELEQLGGPITGRIWTAELGDGCEIDFVPIPEGSFQMGSKDGPSNEKPVHKVTLSQPFWMAQTEVTQSQYREVMGTNPSYLQRGDRPVERVSWDDAMTFCEKLTQLEQESGRLPDGWRYTLPTEAQWEYACRAGTIGDYAGELDDMGWYSRNSRGLPYSVGAKKANAWGLYDMHGNVWEWCLDDWHSSYYGAPTDGSRRGDGSGTQRVRRGGSWDDGASFCRSASRSGGGPSSLNSYLGFRPVLQQRSTAAVDESR